MHCNHTRKLFVRPGLVRGVLHGLSAATLFATAFPAMAGTLRLPGANTLGKTLALASNRTRPSAPECSFHRNPQGEHRLS